MYGMSICYLKKNSTLRHAHFCFRRSKGEKDSKQKNKGKEGKSNQNLCFRSWSCYFCQTHFCSSRIRAQLRGRAAMWWSSSSRAGLAELELCQTHPKRGLLPSRTPPLLPPHLAPPLARFATAARSRSGLGDLLPPRPPGTPLPLSLFYCQRREA